MEYNQESLSASSLTEWMEASTASLADWMGTAKTLAESVVDLPSGEHGYTALRAAPFQRSNSLDPSSAKRPLPPLRRSHTASPSARRPRRGRKRTDREVRARNAVRVTNDDRLQRIVDEVAVTEDRMRAFLEQEGQLDAIKAYFRKGGAITNSSYREGIHFYVMSQTATKAA